MPLFTRLFSKSEKLQEMCLSETKYEIENLMCLTFHNLIIIS
jgi:hypothetical protein